MSTSEVPSDHLPDFSHEYEVSPEQAARFRSEGWTVLRDVFPAAAIEPYRPLLRAAWAEHKLNDRPMADRDTYGRAFTQALNLGLRDRRIFRFAYGRRFAKIAADLMGVAGVRMFLDEAFFKEPGSGPTPWHQDQPAWPFDAERGVTLWIPLMKVTPEMGAITFASGSHRDGMLLAADISDESDQFLGRVVAERGFAPHACSDLAVGDITAHDGWMVHRAGPNRTDEVREAYAMHYFADGARVLRTDSRLHERILEQFAPGLRAGDLAASDRWRRVYPELDPLVTPL
jgi:ectoine hydroxylase-related dioxygenase (phytanoyl-CoA dioxygenase family)